MKSYYLPLWIKLNSYVVISAEMDYPVYEVFYICYTNVQIIGIDCLYQMLIYVG